MNMTMPITKAILTGGGRATRLRPITTTLNKHLIPLGRQPMIFYAIDKAVAAGVTDIFINVNPGEDQLQKAVGDGSRWGIAITYFEQTGGPQGIAHVVKCAQSFIGKDPFMFYLSDNVVLGSLKPLFEKFEQGKLDCLLALAEVPDAKRFGVPVFDEAKQLIDVIEKPAVPASNYAVTGIYLYNYHFFEAFDHIQKSARGEYEISSIHSYLLKHKYAVGYEEITGWWKDTGTPQDLITLNHLLLDQDEAWPLRSEKMLNESSTGFKVTMGENVTIGKNVTILGPAVIGDNCHLDNCCIQPYTTIGKDCTIRQATIADSIIFDGCQIDYPLSIKEGIIGKNSVIRAHHQGDFHRLVVGDFTSIEL